MKKLVFGDFTIQFESGPGECLGDSDIEFPSWITRNMFFLYYNFMLSGHIPPFNPAVQVEALKVSIWFKNEVINKILIRGVLPALIGPGNSDIAIEQLYPFIQDCPILDSLLDICFNLSEKAYLDILQKESRRELPKASLAEVFNGETVMIQKTSNSILRIEVKNPVSVVYIRSNMYVFTENTEIRVKKDALDIAENRILATLIHKMQKQPETLTEIPMSCPEDLLAHLLKIVELEPSLKAKLASDWTTANKRDIPRRIQSISSQSTYKTDTDLDSNDEIDQRKYSRGNRTDQSNSSEKNKGKLIGGLTHAKKMLTSLKMKLKSHRRF